MCCWSPARGMRRARSSGARSSRSAITRRSRRHSEARTTVPASALWTLQEVIAAAGGQIEGTPPAKFSGVSIDSRSVGAGDIFVAIKGERLDGHEFVAAALKADAGLAIVARADDGMRQ